MLKKNIPYEDYNGEMRSEDFYFNLNKVEIARLDMFTPGGLKHHIERLAQTKDYKGIMEFVENLVKLSYGVKSEDGKTFKKSEELTKAFMETEAYSELMMEFLSEDGDVKLAAFIEGILPQKIVEQIKLEQAKAEFKEEHKAIAETAEKPEG